MKREPSRDEVIARLESLRRSHVPERDVDARRRLSADAARGRRPVPFAEAAGARLAELRALLELTRHLQRGARDSLRREVMALDDLAARVAAALEPLIELRAAWLFGSRASGTARADSDLDVAVAWAPDLSDDAREQARRRAVGTLTDALGALGEQSDVVDLDRADAAVAMAAIRHGLLVVARSESDRVQAQVRVARRYDDETPKRALFRRAAIDAARRMGAHGRS